MCLTREHHPIGPATLGQLYDPGLIVLRLWSIFRSDRLFRYGLNGLTKIFLALTAVILTIPRVGV